MVIWDGERKTLSGPLAITRSWLSPPPNLSYKIPTAAAAAAYNAWSCSVPAADLRLAGRRRRRQVANQLNSRDRIFILNASQLTHSPGRLLMAGAMDGGAWQSIAALTHSLTPKLLNRTDWVRKSSLSLLQKISSWQSLFILQPS